eukprot:TRINITY_DN8513_c0_g1_i1.p1 TRINITY_DN8513_c0_g1~~TRINITY_DN8513_c0_g1_i1.p1  ORF type:complete len:230 (+),score=61.38 TRINITY_DN8513_c0_g1_i1:51-692(+)
MAPLRQQTRRSAALVPAVLLCVAACGLVFYGQMAYVASRHGSSPDASNGLLRRQLLRGGVGLGLSVALSAPAAYAVDANSAEVKHAVETLRSCQKSVEEAFGGLTGGSGWKQTPADAMKATKAKMDYSPLSSGACSAETLSSASNTVASIATADSCAAKGLNRVTCEAAQDASKRVLEAQAKLIEADAKRQGPRVFGALTKFKAQLEALLKIA